MDKPLDTENFIKKVMKTLGENFNGRSAVGLPYVIQVIEKESSYYGGSFHYQLVYSYQQNRLEFGEEDLYEVFSGFDIAASDKKEDLAIQQIDCIHKKIKDKFGNFPWYHNSFIVTQGRITDGYEIKIVHKDSQEEKKDGS